MNRKILFLLAIIFHFSVIVLHNVASSAVGYQAVYGSDKQASAMVGALALCQRFIASPLIQYYAYFSGTETGYGFFAPQVGSQYISRFTLYDGQGDILGEYENPGLRQREGLLRYSGFLDLFQDIADAVTPNDSLNMRVARATACSLGERLGEKHGASRVRCQVLVYRYSRLSGFGENKSALLSSLYEKTIELPHRL